MYDIIITENLLFRLSTRILEAGVFKNLYSGDRFRKPALLVHEKDVNVWTVGLNFPFSKLVSGFIRTRPSIFTEQRVFLYFKRSFEIDCFWHTA